MPLVALLAAISITIEAADTEPVYRFVPAVEEVAAASGQPPLFYPSGVAVGPDGAVWIADTANHVIRRLNGERVPVVVAGVVSEPGALNGPALSATFRYPQGLTFDSAGNLYIADSGNGVIRRLRTDGYVETWAGDPDERGTHNGDRLKASFVTPLGLAWDVTGELWISDFSAHTIRRVNADGKVITVSGVDRTPGFENGPGERSLFHNPAGIDIDPQGRLLVADSGNGAIRAVDRDGFTYTISGLEGLQGHRDGAMSEARFDHPADLVIDEEGGVFIADSWSHTIRMIRDGMVVTIAGRPGSRGNRNGSGDGARFDNPVLDRPLQVRDALRRRYDEPDDSSGIRGRARNRQAKIGGSLTCPVRLWISPRDHSEEHRLECAKGRLFRHHEQLVPWLQDQISSSDEDIVASDDCSDQ